MPLTASVVQTSPRRSARPKRSAPNRRASWTVWRGTRQREQELLAHSGGGWPDPLWQHGGRRKPNGLVLYRGPSLLNGQGIVCIATGLARKSKNATTGPVVQTYILPDGKASPLMALDSGANAAVCGDCPHRPIVLPDSR